MSKPVYLQNMPEWVVRELDRRYPLVQSGSLTLHKNDGKAVKFEHRDVGTAQEVKQ